MTTQNTEKTETDTRQEKTQPAAPRIVKILIRAKKLRVAGGIAARGCRLNVTETVAADLIASGHAERIY